MRATLLSQSTRALYVQRVSQTTTHNSGIFAFMSMHVNSASMRAGERPRALEPPDGARPPVAFSCALVTCAKYAIAKRRTRSPTQNARAAQAAPFAFFPPRRRTRVVRFTRAVAAAAARRAVSNTPRQRDISLHLPARVCQRASERARAVAAATRCVPSCLRPCRTARVLRLRVSTLTHSLPTHSRFACATPASSSRHSQPSLRQR